MTQLAILSLIQSQICTQVYVVGTADRVLIREVSLSQSARYRQVSLYLTHLWDLGAYAGRSSKPGLLECYYAAYERKRNVKV